MNINLIQKSIIPILVSTLLLGVFYWQFTYIYASLIEIFTEEKLSILYFHLFIYVFLILILFVSLINLLNLLLIKSNFFPIISISVLLIFYTLSSSIYINIFQYLLHFPLSEDMIMGAILFVVGAFGYSLYSLVGLFFHKFIPIIHTLLFTILGLGYATFFIDAQGYSILNILTKF